MAILMWLLLLCIPCEIEDTETLDNFRYTNYTHVLHSLLEAEGFDGPSLVLAYLPREHGSRSVNSVEEMTNSKIAVDSYVLATLEMQYLIFL